MIVTFNYRSTLLYKYIIKRQTVFISFFILSIAILAITSTILLPAVFSSRSGIPGKLHVSYSNGSGILDQFIIPSDSPDSTFIRNISSGRFQLRSYDTSATELHLDFTFAKPRHYSPRRLIVRSMNSEIESIVVYAVSDSDTSNIGSLDVASSKNKIIKGYYSKTYIIPLNPLTVSDKVAIQITRAGSHIYPFMFEDIGLYESQEGPLCDNRLFMKSIPRDLFASKLYYELILFGVIGIMMTFIIVRKRVAVFLVPMFVFVIALGLLVSELYIAFPSNAETEDLRVLCSRVSFEGGGSNLNWGLCMASAFLRNDGLTTFWNRMPGYGLLSIIAGITSGDPTNFALMGIHMIFIQVVFFVIAVTFFAYCALKIMSQRAAVIIAIVIVVLPNQFFLTQVDSIMVSILLLISGTLFLYLYKKNIDERISFVTKQILESKNYKKSMLQNMFL